MYPKSCLRTICQRLGSRRLCLEVRRLGLGAQRLVSVSKADVSVSGLSISGFFSFSKADVSVSGLSISGLISVSKAARLGLRTQHLWSCLCLEGRCLGIGTHCLGCRYYLEGRRLGVVHFVLFVFIFQFPAEPVTA